MYVAAFENVHWAIKYACEKKKAAAACSKGQQKMVFQLSKQYIDQDSKLLVLFVYFAYPA